MTLRALAPLPLLLLGLGSLSTPDATASADVYRQVDADGVESFTDAPVEDHVKLIIRESGEERRSREGRPAPRRAPESRGARADALPVSGTVTSRVGLRTDPVDGLLRQHQGYDVAVPEGTPVRAIAPGRVTFSGVKSGYGNAVVVDHGEGFVSLYAHNSVNAVAEGQWVGKDEVLALSGSTGRSTGPHVHFELWRDGVNRTEEYVRVGEIAGLTHAVVANREDALIRRIILADGSVLFTNLP